MININLLPYREILRKENIVNHAVIAGGTVFLVLVLIVLLGCDSDTKEASNVGFQGLPSYMEIRQFPDTDNNALLVPSRIHRYYDTLYVSFQDRPFIDKFSMGWEKLERIYLDDPEPVSPNDFFVTDSFLVALSYRRQMVILYDHRGKLVESFGTQPDGTTPLVPYSVYCYGGVAYVGDIGMKGVMAIWLANADQITTVGELILTIPSDTAHLIGFPGAVIVTFDGRLIVSDATDEVIKVFTCDGRFIYNLDSLPPFGYPPAIQAFVYDNIPDPAMLDTTKFDPSNMAMHGRLHAVDAVNHKIHMFNTLGKYVASYPPDTTILVRPVDITLDHVANIIYVVDPERKALVLFKYEE